ncbi:RHS repeat-associated core domain-containing protein [Pokkaliibacter sp. MBI-7]|uniref:RHS repeat-associated core domain-containing protein n=1 Tax=Pokkaliibacter sp. MBI-7 TaxID=3040600 RepID=UPI002447D093|nr:RHS repeat-associated core domain-containing protein [Pokkaliibacter sp. MBI-7]MDH2433318.1 RHS repeat-associated core domain-containing protein [Pokkaliibacter sp. MBI-7]
MLHISFQDRTGTVLVLTDSPSRAPGLPRVPAARLQDLPETARQALNMALDAIGDSAASRTSTAQLAQAAAAAVDQGRLYLFASNPAPTSNSHGRGYAAITPKAVALPAGFVASSDSGGLTGGFNPLATAGPSTAFSQAAGVLGIAAQVKNMADDGFSASAALNVLGSVARLATGSSISGNALGPVTMNLTGAEVMELPPIVVTACDVPLDEQDYLGDPVSLSSGEEVLRLVDARLPGKDGLLWQRLYRSRLSDVDLGMGRGWRTPFHVRIEEGRGQDSDKLIYVDEDGRRIAFGMIGTGGISYQMAEGLRLSRRFEAHRGDDELVIYFADGHLKSFRRHNRSGPWRLHLWLTPHTSSWRCHYNEQQRLQRIRLDQRLELRLYYEPGRQEAKKQDPNSPDHRHHLLQVHHFRLGDDPDNDDQAERVAVVARYTYSADGELLSATDQHGRTEHYEYEQGLLTRRTLPSGYVHHLLWQGGGIHSRCVEQYGDDKSFHYRMLYDEVQRQAQVTQTDGQHWQYHYNPDWQLQRRVAPDGGEEQYHYDEQQRLCLHIDADGHHHRYHYDELGRLSEERHGEQHLYHRYNDLGQRIATADALGFHFVRSFDASGLLLEERQGVALDELQAPSAQARSVRYQYDSPAQVLSQLQGAGQIPLAFGYRVNTVRKVGEPEFHNQPGCPLVAQQGPAVWKYSYTPQGQLNALLTPAGEVISYLYGNSGQIERCSRFPLGDKTLAEHTRYRYDDAGRLVQLTAADGSVEQISYSGHYQPSALTQADGSSLHLSYDTLRQLTGLLRSDHAFYRLHYDACQRLIQSEHFDERQRHYRWSPGGQLLEIREGKAGYADTVRIELQRDALGNMVRRHTYLGSRQPHPDSSDDYHYDQRSRLTGAHNEAARLAQQWLPDNRLSAAQGWIKDGMHELHEWRLGWQYDAQGRLQHLQLADGSQLTRHYDHFHRLTGLSYQGQRVLSRSLNAFGSEEERYAGETSTAPAGALLRQGYDCRNRLLTQHSQGRQRDYHYGLHQQLQQVDDSELGSVCYGYDALRQLTEELHTDREGAEQRRAYVFDSWGNPSHFKGLPAEATHDRLTLLGNRRFHHDERGNQTAVYSVAGELLQRRVFDGLNQLREVQGADYTAVYHYDPLGRRVCKEVSRYEQVREEDDGDDPSTWTRRLLSRQRTFYYWSGNQLIGESTDGHYRWYIYESLPDQPQQDSHRPLLLIDNGEVYHYLLDHRGAPFALLDQQGNSVWRAQMDAWGQAVILQADIRNPLRLQGQYCDDESGLHYQRYRYFDPATGRFISQDPIGLLGGLNPYRYAPNPISWIDPLGLCAEALEEVAGNGTEPGLLASAGSVIADLLPGVGSLKSIAQVVTGEDLVTGEPVDRLTEAGGILLGLIPGGKLLTKGKKAINVLGKAADAASAMASKAKALVDPLLQTAKGKLDDMAEAVGDLLGSPQMAMAGGPGGNGHLPGSAGKSAGRLLNRAEAESTILERVGSNFKHHPLRQAYETEVAALSRYADKIRPDMTKAELKQLAIEANEARRALGVKYKNATPEPLRDFIYEVNKERYGDPLGPTVEYLVEKGRTYKDIILSSATPNADVDKLLSKFSGWLTSQSDDKVSSYLNSLGG